MKSFFSIFLTIFFVLFFFSTSSFSAEKNDFNLTPDVSMKLILMDKLRSGDSKKNDRVNYKVDEDVLDKNGKVLIKKGTPAYGTVLNSRRSGMWGKRGALDVSVEYTSAIDGQRVALRANKEKRGGGSKSLMTAGAILVAWPLAFCKGSNVSIDPGTTFVAYVDDNLKIGIELNSTIEQNKDNENHAQTAVSDKLLVLNNGDRISGQILGLQNGIYSIKTKMGTFNVKENEIKTIETINNAVSPKDISPEKKEKSELEKKLDQIKNKKK